MQDIACSFNRGRQQRAQLQYSKPLKHVILGMVNNEWDFCTLAHKQHIALQA